MLAGTVLAGSSPDAAPVPDGAPDSTPPPLPDEHEPVPEPKVTIIHREGETISQYSINGQVYLIKVKPAKGPAYYLIDTDGDGNLETRRDELDPVQLVPAWVILRW
ncbi:MAG: DUF2782 domain-containing protein [Gammaproteobacteria bacterium]|nr:MAG: DUF2782 domain-containing protein [Gammaproteobacteria bacterium]